MSLIGYIEGGRKRADPGPIPLGPVMRTGDIASASNMALKSGAVGIHEMLATGLMTPDEARLRLEHEIFGSFGIPGPALDSHAYERHACYLCDMEFTGTQDALARSLAVHEESGQCEQRRRQRGFPIA